MKQRDWNAVSAHFRQAGSMRDRRAPRGGARNEARELIDEGLEALAEEQGFDAEADLTACEAGRCPLGCSR